MRIVRSKVVEAQTNIVLNLKGGWDIAGVINEDDPVAERFGRRIGLAGYIGMLAAVTHHTGSWTNGTFYIHNNHRGDIILVRSGTTTVSSYDYSAFGNLQS
ncbi:MAG: hypothetical protein NZ739_11265, partial [Verrucomicrobiae bacterium]|nr:hypothetical protein [Verrucomicrobiae bacterium]